MTEYRVTCIPGDGIGPEIMAATKVAVAATGVRIEWIDVEAGADVMDKYGTPLPQAVIDSIRDTKVAIKGPITTPVGSGFRSVNVALRKELDLYANLRPAVSIPGVRSRYEGVDLVIVRENTEDLYAGVEHMVGHDAAESIKIITRRGQRAHRPLRLRLRPPREAAQGHRRPQGQHHEAAPTGCSWRWPAKWPAATPTSSSRTASSTTCACSWCRSPSCTTCCSAPTSTATS